jgi:hypothetical protein
MPIQTRSQLKPKFEKGDIPNQDDFWNFIDTMISQGDDGINVALTTEKGPAIGIGLKQTLVPLAILSDGKTNNVLGLIRNKSESKWGIHLSGDDGDTKGFFLDNTPDGKTVNTRLFIDELTGKMGIGTITPTAKVSISESNSGGQSGITVKNTAAGVSSPGWGFLHISDTTIAERDGAVGIFEEAVQKGPRTERMIFLAKTGFAGMNESNPNTIFHVSRSATDPKTGTELLPNTGIAMFGQIGQSVAVDNKGIQSRTGVLQNNNLVFSLGALHLQNLGGDLLVHGKASIEESKKFIIKDDGKTGVGILAPAEQLHVNGRIVVGDSAVATSVAGAIRWNGTDFQGYNGTDWLSLGGESAFWSEGPAADTIRYNAPNAKVGIGVDEPTNSLHVADNSHLLNGNGTAVKIANTSDTESTAAADSRIGLEITCSGTWSTDLSMKNVGLYVSAGGSNANANLSAVLNGNVSIGTLNSSAMVGSAGTNVLVIQNGVNPLTKVGASNLNNGGVQLFSINSNSVSTFGLMNGNGDKITLFKGAALTASSSSTAAEPYSAATAALINNMKTRIDELDARLRALGLLAAPVAPPPINPGDPQA